MKHEMPVANRTAVLVCLVFGTALYLGLTVYGFILMGFSVKLFATFLVYLPGFACAFARHFGWRGVGRKVTHR